jgi:hypothetical protein
MSGGEKSEANCTAMKTAAKSSHEASVEGTDCGREWVVSRSVIAGDAVAIRIAGGKGTRD